MKKKTFLFMQTILILLTALLILCGKTSDSAGKKGQAETTITGVVLKRGTDESGNVSAVAIDVDLEDSYVYYEVIMDQKGMELTRQVDNTVKVTGRVEEDIVKKKSIQVTHWELVKEKTTSNKKK